MKRKINPFSAYVINITDDGYYLSDCNGFVFESEDLIEIGKNLINYAKKHKEELKQHNIENQKFYNEQFEWCKPTTKQRKPKTEAYVYILKCGAFYKIGFSKDVERRVKELDYRPFKIDVVYVSPLTSNAYEIEQRLHEWLEEYRRSGEWYDLPNEMLELIVGEIKRGVVEDEIYD